jgi:putative phage-type endonuclease
MKTHDLIQGSDSWLAYRANHFNASDAPAMLGCSPYKTRSQLLHEMVTGQAQDVDAGTQRRFDEGHRIEALARPLAEKIIGEDLYPVVGSEGKYSASFDGLTMDELTGFEHKTMNNELRTAMTDQGNGYGLPLQYQVQMEHQLMVSGADRILFMATKWDGYTLVEQQHCWYASDRALRRNIVMGWDQFEKDLEAYQAPEVIVPAVATPQMGLPAVFIQVEGSISLVHDLDKFGAALKVYVERINKKPETDQDFADLEATVKTLKNAEKALDSAEAGALAQTDSIDAMRKTVALYRETAHTNRLLVEKLVKAEKENRRTAIVSDAAAELVTHVKKLNERLGKPYMPIIPSDFQGVIKGLNSLDRMKDKVSVELARCKIAANEAADRIQANLTTLRELASGHAFLFADAAQLVGTANDNLTALVKSRIADYKAAEEAKEEETRERIRADEVARIEREQAEKARIAEAERARAAKIEAERIQREQAEAAQQERIRAKLVANNTPAQSSQQVLKAEPATLKLGDINARLAPVNVSSLVLSELGIDYEQTNGVAKIYSESQFNQICEAMIHHIKNVQFAAALFKKAV